MTIKLTKRCSEFREHIVSFNNAVSFTSEKIDKLDDSAVPFICRIQGQLHHYLGSLHAADGYYKMFMQIYLLDSSQEELEERLHHLGGLPEEQLRVLQHILHRVNPYVEGLKNASKRLAEIPEPRGQRLALCQIDSLKAQRGTHNKPISDEVAVVICDTDINGPNPIERDIIVQTEEGRLQRVPY